MKLLKIADSKIIQKRLTDAGTENGMSITKSQRKFYLQMMAYFVGHPLDSVDENGDLRCCLSVKQLAEITGLPQRTAVFAIAELTKCGVIIRTGGSLRYGRITTTIFPKKYWRE